MCICKLIYTYHFNHQQDGSLSINCSHGFISPNLRRSTAPCGRSFGARLFEGPRMGMATPQKKVKQMEQA